MEQKVNDDNNNNDDGYDELIIMITIIVIMIIYHHHCILLFCAATLFCPCTHCSHLYLLFIIIIIMNDHRFLPSISLLHESLIKTKQNESDTVMYHIDCCSERKMFAIHNGTNKPYGSILWKWWWWCQGNFLALFCHTIDMILFGDYKKQRVIFTHSLRCSLM